MILACDFENTVPSDNREFNTRVWGAGFAPIGSDRPTLCNSMDEFFNSIQFYKNPILYTHNLTYDGKLILDWLYRQGFKLSSDKRLKTGYMSHLITDNGQFYYIKVKYNRTLITFRDSCKILPMSLDRLAKDLDIERKLYGDIDYTKERGEDYKMDDNDKRYLSRDIVILSKALFKVQQHGFLDYLTIGKRCISEYMDMYEKYVPVWFPRLTEELDSFIRESYKGGWVYCNPEIQGKLLSDVHSYDVNSLYPFEMKTQYFPYGEPIARIQSFEDLQTYQDKAYFVKCEITCKIKDKHLPWLQIKHDIYDASERITEISEPQIVTFTKMDIELLFEHYDVSSFTVLDGYVFNQRKGMFNKYIDKYFNMKVQNNHNPTFRLIAKLMLNNLGGQFGTNPSGKLKQSSYTDKLQFEYIDSSKNSLYVPVASYMTSYARCYTIRYAQQNYDVFCYSDTDSIKTLGAVDNLPEHDVNLGAFKLEYVADYAKFIKAKSYLVHTDKGYDVTLAGASKPVQDNIINHPSPFKYFTVGQTVPGDLVPIVVPGGVALYPTQYTLN